MGRAEWFSWVGGGSIATARRRRMYPDMKETDKETSSGSGCMCSAFHFFDSHPLKIVLSKRRPSVSFRPDSHFSRREEPSASIGGQAPKNSVELEERTAMKGGLKPETSRVEENLNFPKGIQIKTRISTSRTTEESSAEFSSSSSPGTTTPNLVARLMGLDLIAESNPTPKMKSHLGNFLLHESSRPSLNDDMREKPRISSPRRSLGWDENLSPGQYAKQIVKKVKESVVGRRAGLVDITNTNTENLETRRDQNLVTLKKAFHVSEINSSKKDTADSGSTKSSRTSTSSESQVIFSLSKVQNQQEKNQTKTEISESIIMKKKEEQFVRSPSTMKTTSAHKKSKRIPLSRDFGNANALVPVKKVHPAPDKKLPKKQLQVPDDLSSKRTTQLSRTTSQSYKEPENIIPDNRNCGATTTVAAAPVAEYKHYVRRILRRAGIIDGATPLTLGKWHTPSHPLDPSIFYYLELFNRAGVGAALNLRCNRKLIFQVVDEILAGILKPSLDFKPWGGVRARFDRFDLVDEICRKLGLFPAAKCQVLGDIDSLVDGDLIEQPKLDGFLEEEGEKLISEIEGEILESLMLETVAVVGPGGYSPANWYRTRHCHVGARA